MTTPISINGKDDIIQYIFDLTLVYILPMGDIESIKFNEIQYNKYCILFKHSDKIKFNKINTFNIYVTIIHDNIKEIINITKEFNCQNDTFIYQNNDLYIEFTQNSEGYTNCSCYIKTHDKVNLFNTPPNY